jgi:hypothetical protein
VPESQKDKKADKRFLENRKLLERLAKQLNKAFPTN